MGDEESGKNATNEKSAASMTNSSTWHMLLVWLQVKS